MAMPWPRNCRGIVIWPEWSSGGLCRQHVPPKSRLFSDTVDERAGRGPSLGCVKGRRLTTTNNARIVDMAAVDLNTVVADKQAIRKYNPQRFDMEQIDAVVLEDTDRAICIGYKDVRADEFWVAGHMPDMPLMPGVLICEAAAQLASYFTLKHDLLGAELVGLGGMEEIRFRGRVVPGDRLVIVLQQVRVRRGALIVCRFEGFVRDTLVVEGKIMGARLQ